MRGGPGLGLAPAGRGGGALRAALPPPLASASQLRELEPERDLEPGPLQNPSRNWGSESGQQPGLRRWQLPPCQVRARRLRAWAPAPTGLCGALPGHPGELSFKPLLTPPTRPDL